MLPRAFRILSFDQPAILIALLCIPFYLCAQKESLQFQHIGNELGLRDDNIAPFVFKDKEGFVWIGSSTQGLFRFDGSALQPITDRIDSLTNANIQSLCYEDKKGKLWLTSYQFILCYDKLHKSIEPFRIEYDSILIDKEYKAFHFDQKQQTLWVATDSLIWLFDTQTKKADLIIQNASGYRFLLDTLSNNDRLFSFPWLKKPGFEIWERKEEHWVKTDFSSGFFEDAIISKGIQENDSTLWLISNKGLIEFSLTHLQTKNIYAPSNEKTFSLKDGLQTSADRLFLAYAGDGLRSFDLNKREFLQHWTASPTESVTNTLSSNQAVALNLDHENVLWVTLRNRGIDYAQILQQNFENPLEALSHSGYIIKNITEDRFQRIWVLDANLGIFVFNLEGELLFQFPKIKEVDNFSLAYLSSDPLGQIWLNTPDQVFRYSSSDLSSKHWEVIISKKSKTRYYSLSHNSNGQTFLIDIEGVFEIKNQGNNFKLTPIPLFKGFKNFPFRYFHEISSNTFLAPLYGKDILIFSTNNTPPLLLDTIPFSAETYDIYEDQKKTLWLASRNGLFKKTQNEAPALIIKNNALGGDSKIFAIEEDQKGILWLSTTNGIWSFNPESNQLRRLTQIENLPSSLYLRGNSLKASNGNIWFDSPDGLTVFNPKEVEFPSPKLSLFLNNFWVNNKEDDRPISLDSNTILQLRYTENNLDFELGTITSNSNNNISIKYRLLPHSPNWTIVQFGDLISFEGLEPNQYRLELLPMDPYFQEGNPQSLSFYINPPFWKTTWFQVSAFFGIMGLIFSSFWFYFQRKINKQKALLLQQQLINNERDRIAKELHDDLGGGLSSILFISEDLTVEETNTDKKQQTKRITQLSKNALTNMRDIIWVLDDQQNSLDDFVQRAKTYSNLVFGDAQINYSFKSSLREASTVLLSSAVKRNLLLIFKESIHNILKHAAATEVNINIEVTSKCLNLIIEDNGKGFDKSLKKSPGLGLPSIKKRIREIEGQIKWNTELNKGTKVSISVPLEL